MRFLSLEAMPQVGTEEVQHAQLTNILVQFLDKASDDKDILMLFPLWKTA